MKSIYIFLSTLILALATRQPAQADDLGSSFHFVLSGNPQVLFPSVRDDQSYKYLEGMFDKASGINIQEIESVVLAWTDSETDKGSGVVDAIVGLQLAEKIDQQKIIEWIHTFAIDNLKESDKHPGFYSTGDFGNGVYFHDSKTVFLASSDPLSRLIADKKMGHLATFFHLPDKKKLAEFSFQPNATSRAFFKLQADNLVKPLGYTFTEAEIENIVGQVSLDHPMRMEIVITSKNKATASKNLDRVNELLVLAKTGLTAMKKGNESRREYQEELKNETKKKMFAEDIDAHGDFISLGQDLLPMVKTVQDETKIRLSVELKKAPKSYVKPILRHMALSFRYTPWGRDYDDQ